MTEGVVQQHLRLPSLAHEMWWGGAVADGQLMPFGTRPYRPTQETVLQYARDLLSAGFPPAC